MDSGSPKSWRASSGSCALMSSREAAIVLTASRGAAAPGGRGAGRPSGAACIGAACIPGGRDSSSRGFGAGRPSGAGRPGGALGGPDGGASAAISSAEATIVMAARGLAVGAPGGRGARMEGGIDRSTVGGGSETEGGTSSPRDAANSVGWSWYWASSGSGLPCGPASWAAIAGSWAQRSSMEVASMVFAASRGGAPAPLPEDGGGIYVGASLCW